MPSADLGAVAQEMIGEHDGHHRLADGYRADTDAGIMPALGDDLRFASRLVDGLARDEDRRCRLHREAAHDGLAGGDAAENTAGVVRQKARLSIAADADLVGVLLAGKLRSPHAGADLD